MATKPFLKKENGRINSHGKPELESKKRNLLVNPKGNHGPFIKLEEKFAAFLCNNAQVVMSCTPIVFSALRNFPHILPTYFFFIFYLVVAMTAFQTSFLFFLEKTGLGNHLTSAMGEQQWEVKRGADSVNPESFNPPCDACLPQKTPPIPTPGRTVLSISQSRTVLPSALSPQRWQGCELTHSVAPECVPQVSRLAAGQTPQNKPPAEVSSGVPGYLHGIQVPRRYLVYLHTWYQVSGARYT